MQHASHSILFVLPPLLPLLNLPLSLLSRFTPFLPSISFCYLLTECYTSTKSWRRLLTSWTTSHRMSGTWVTSHCMQSCEVAGLLCWGWGGKNCVWLVSIWNGKHNFWWQTTHNREDFDPATCMHADSDRLCTPQPPCLANQCTVMEVVSQFGKCAITRYSLLHGS